MVSTREILKAESTFNNPRARDVLFDRTTLLEIMAPWPPTIAPEADVKEAAQQMLYVDAQRLFVEDEGNLVGVISQSDVVAAVARTKI